MNITNPSERISITSWAPNSWKNFPRSQAPQWYDRQILEKSMSCLTQSSALVSPSEINSLTRKLEKSARGESFILQCGNCAENFSDCTEITIQNFLYLLFRMADILSSSVNIPVVKIGRIAGQYAKPRSNDVEIVNGVKLPVYRGDMVNGFEPVLEKRRHDPARVLEGYSRSAFTLDMIRSFAGEIHGQISCFRGKEKDNVEIYTSHEALLLEYEQAMTRQENVSGLYYDTSAHMLWVGDRTRQIGSAYIEFLRGISNPVGMKIGPEYQLNEILETIVRLNPENRSGKICLIPRFGVKKIESLLPQLIQAVKAHAYNVVWICDPMHGNTHVSAAGKKIRKIHDILGEIKSFWEIHKRQETVPGGVHLELTPDHVAECIGGKSHIREEEAAGSYTSTCDPRLNADQSLEVAFFVSQLLKQ